MPPPVGDDAGFSLYKLGKTMEVNTTAESEDHPYLWAYLLKLQLLCMNDFYEKLRLPTAPSVCDKALPLLLQAKSLDQAQWFLVIDSDLLWTGLG